jgi:hypothetical protein
MLASGQIRTQLMPHHTQSGRQTSVPHLLPKA